MRRIALIPLAAVASVAGAQSNTLRPAPAMSAPLSDIQYTVQYDRTTAPRRVLHVSMAFSTPGRDAVMLSLPAWTPGAYEISNYARDVLNFAAVAGTTSLVWDKIDYDTWRVEPAGAKQVTVSFDFIADSLDNAMAWTKPDFAFFNGTNVLLYPEGRGFDFPASVTIATEPEWTVATSMPSAGGPRRYQAGNYHDLVDMPFFVGQFDLDSAQVAGRWVRLATYPRTLLSGGARREFWSDLQHIFPAEIAVTGETPYDSYTVEIVFDSSYGGGSALEHHSSHMGIYTPLIIGNPVFASITAHEIFHLWNVKRMRPAGMVPYRYDRPEPTPWLWVSEGITDYYADLALVRGGITDSTGFLDFTNGKIGHVAQTVPVSLEDASLSTWVHPRDGTDDIYYDKGSLAGFLLDILIRDASDNAHSLDDVMQDVYRRTYKASQRGFTAQDWWGAVSRAAGGKSFTEFAARYIDGREPFPYDSVLPLAGFRVSVDTTRAARIGVFTQSDTSGIVVTEVEPGGAAEQAGVRPGDVLVQVGEVPVADATFGARFRARYDGANGASAPVTVRRNGESLTLPMTVRVVTETSQALTFDRTASPKAARIRASLLRGR